jgi:hypothetical protein
MRLPRAASCKAANQGAGDSAGFEINVTRARRVNLVVREQPQGPLKTPLAGLSRPDVAGFDRICPLRNSPSLGSLGVHATRGWNGDPASVRNVAGRGGVP